jgi:hypothetical protein
VNPSVLLRNLGTAVHATKVKLPRDIIPQMVPIATVEKVAVLKLNDSKFALVPAL